MEREELRGPAGFELWFISTKLPEEEFPRIWAKIYASGDQTEHVPRMTLEWQIRENETVVLS